LNAAVSGELESVPYPHRACEFNPNGSGEGAGDRHGDAFVGFASGEKEAEGGFKGGVHEANGVSVAHADKAAFLAGEVVVGEDRDDGVGAG
jgi:hypothetical protein